MSAPAEPKVHRFCAARFYTFFAAGAGTCPRCGSSVPPSGSGARPQPHESR